MKHIALNTRIYTITCFAALLGAFGAQADEKIVCKSGSSERTIEVVYEAEGKTLPCKVNYEKSEADGGSRPGLYSATTQEGYCTEKAAELKGKLEAGGWDCGGGTAAEGTGSVAPEKTEPAPDQSGATE